MAREHQPKPGEEPQLHQDSEIPFNEAVRRADKATTDLYQELANHARETAKTDPSLTPEYVESQLKRRDADKAGRDRIKNHLLEMLSREHKFTFEGGQAAVPEKEVPLVKGKPENLLGKVGGKLRQVFKRGN